jgi:hypothetical protein
MILIASGSIGSTIGLAISATRIAILQACPRFNTNQVFTSYDRSGGTGLDYAQNRSYSKGQSRFTQVDPIAMASTSPDDPQSMLEMIPRILLIRVGWTVRKRARPFTYILRTWNPLRFWRRWRQRRLAIRDVDGHRSRPRHQWRH